MSKPQCVLYTRVSTKKNEQKLSLQLQREVYTEYCEKKGWELVEIFADEGLSGTNARREKFIEMMYRAGLDYVKRENDSDVFETSDREPEFDYIITKDVSRYARNEEIGMSTAKQLRALGVYIIFENGGISTKDKNWKLMLSILFSIAESYSSDLSEKVRFTKRYHAKKHRYKPSRLPYGYKFNKDKIVVIVPEQAEIVRYVFENYNQKGGLVLAKELNERGITSQTGAKWSGNKIIRMIKNSIYIGTAVVQRTYKDDVTSTKRKERKEDEFIHIPDVMPPIITETLFNEVNKIRESRVIEGEKRGRKLAKDDMYYQKVKCGICGQNFSRHVTKQKDKPDKILYLCRSRLKQERCGCRGVSITVLNRGLEEIEIRYLVETMREAVQYQELNKRLDDEISKIKESRDELQKKIDELDKKCDMYLTSIMEYKSNGQDKLAKGFEAKYNQLSDEKDELEVIMSSLSVESLLSIKHKAKKKWDKVKEMKSKRNYTVEDRVELLRKVVVSDYELEYFFSVSNYDDEVKEFNRIFENKKIDIESHSYGVKVRRKHKEAKEFWEQVDKG